MANPSAETPYVEGRDAYRKGGASSSCPYDANSEMARHWHNGWNEAKAADIEEEIGSNL
jgi:ribosome modulation factor